MEGNARTWFTPKQKAEPRTPTACCDSISKGNRSLALLSGVPGQDRPAAQSSPRKTLGWCCSDRLNPPPKADIPDRHQPMFEMLRFLRHRP